MRKHYYTLIELIVTLAIITIALALVIGFIALVAVAVKYLFFAAIIPVPVIF